MSSNHVLIEKKDNIASIILNRPQVMNALVRLYADAMQARTKTENGFDLNDYDKRCMKFALDYSEQLLAVDINISIPEMLDRGWTLFDKYFEKFEVGIKDTFIKQYWPGAQESGTGEKAEKEVAEVEKE